MSLENPGFWPPPTFQTRHLVETRPMDSSEDAEDDADDTEMADYETDDHDDDANYEEDENDVDTVNMFPLSDPE